MGIEMGQECSKKEDGREWGRRNGLMANSVCLVKQNNRCSSSDIGLFPHRDRVVVGRDEKLSRVLLGVDGQ